MHLSDPVAQRIHDQLQRVRVAHIQRVTGAGVVHVVEAIPVHQAVVGLIINAAKRDGRAHVVALSGVVVHHIQDHLNARLVVGTHHLLELSYRIARLVGGGVMVFRREEAKRVVAPVVAQSQVAQAIVLKKLVHWQQLDGGYAKVREVFHHRRVCHAGIGAAQVFRNLRVQLCHALDMALINHAFLIRDVGGAVIAPIKKWVDHHRKHGVAERVFLVAASARVVCVYVVGKQGGVLVKLPVKRARIRVDQQLVRVAAFAVFRVPWAVDAVAVALARGNAGEIGVPDVVIYLFQRDPGFLHVLVNQTKLNLGGNTGEKCKVGARPVIRRAQRVSGPWPGLRCLGGAGGLVDGFSHVGRSYARRTQAVEQQSNSRCMIVLAACG